MKSQTVRFKSGADMFETFDAKGGKEYKRPRWLLNGSSAQRSSLERTDGGKALKMAQRSAFDLFVVEVQSGTTAI